jgi:hypothetical protein
LLVAIYHYILKLLTCSKVKQAGSKAKFAAISYLKISVNLFFLSNRLFKKIVFYESISLFFGSTTNLIVTRDL